MSVGGEKLEYSDDRGVRVVSESRDVPRSRLIGLPVIRIRALSEDPKEPIFHLAGGPGQTNLRFTHLTGLIEHDADLLARDRAPARPTSLIRCGTLPTLYPEGGADYISDRDYLGDMPADDSLILAPASALGMAGLGRPVVPLPPELTVVQPPTAETLPISGNADSSTPYRYARDELLPALSNGHTRRVDRAHSFPLAEMNLVFPAGATGCRRTCPEISGDHSGVRREHGCRCLRVSSRLGWLNVPRCATGYSRWKGFTMRTVSTTCPCCMSSV